LASVELEKNSTGNLQRRYSYLFRLPSTGLSLILASLPTIAIELVTRSVLGAGIERTIIYAITTEVALIAGIEIDNLILKRNEIASFRRLSTISIISNGLWFIVSVVGAVVYAGTKNEGRFFSLVLLGVFFAISFRALVFGSVFYPKPARGLPLAIVQPIILLFPTALSLKAISLYSVNTITGIAGGLVLIAGIEIYLSVINKPLDGLRALQLLQAFLNAWTVNNPKDLEHYFQISSEERSVNTTFIQLETSYGSKKPAALLVVPGVHPGPFSPVGSSNLPGDIYESLKTHEIVPLTFHSISDHDLNLPSKEEVKKYTASLQQRETIDTGKKMSLPVTAHRNKATASGFALGKTLLVTLTLAPNGMEDLPGRIREEIYNESKKLGFEMSLVIDSHNSLGERPNEVDTNDLIVAAKEVLNQVFIGNQFEFDFGFSHSSEIGSHQREDIGPAGIGFLLFEVKGSRFCLVVVDANNAKIGFRAEVIQKFETKSSSRILDICTSDTHITAAKASNAKGYLALGDVSSPEEFATTLNLLSELAQARLAQGRYSTSISTSKVRTIGGQVLNNFSGLLDETSQVAKRGAEALGVLAILITAFVGIL